MNLEQQLRELNKALAKVKESISSDTDLVNDIQADISEVQAKIASIPDWPTVYKSDFHNEGPILQESVLNGTTQELDLIDHGLLSDNKNEVMNSLALLRFINKNADTAEVNLLLNVLIKSTMPMGAMAMLFGLSISVNEDIRLLNGTVVSNQDEIDDAELAAIDDDAVIVPDPILEDWRASKDDTKYYIAVEYDGDEISVGNIKNSWQYHYNPIRTSEIAGQIIDKYGARLKMFGAY